MLDLFHLAKGQTFLLLLDNFRGLAGNQSTPMDSPNGSGIAVTLGKWATTGCPVMFSCRHPEKHKLAYINFVPRIYVTDSNVTCSLLFVCWHMHPVSTCTTTPIFLEMFCTGAKEASVARTCSFERDSTGPCASFAKTSLWM